MTKQNIQISETKYGPKGGWICLILGWGFFLLPIPVLSTLVASGLILAAFVLAIISMNRQQGGLALLLASLIVSPVIYFVGFAIFAYMLEQSLMNAL